MGHCVDWDYPKWKESDQHPAARARLQHSLKLQIFTPNKSENHGRNEPNAFPLPGLPNRGYPSPVPILWHICGATKLNYSYH
jgi:hypothetical protein